MRVAVLRQAVAIAFAACVLGHDAFGDLVVSDGDFSSWSSFSVLKDDPFVASPAPSPASGSAARIATGGNPGAFFQATLNIVYGDIIFVGGIKEDFAYNAATDGDFGSLSITADLIHPGAGATAWQLVVEQAGTLYYSFPLFDFSQGGWRTVSATGLTAENFDTNPLAGFDGIAPDGTRPDFSTAGSEIKVGFLFGNRLTGPGTSTNVVGLDNFQVAFVSVPEPASLMMLGVGGLTSAVYRRRKSARTKQGA